MSTCCSLMKSYTEVDIVTRATEYARMAACWQQYLKRLDHYLETSYKKG